MSSVLEKFLNAMKGRHDSGHPCFTALRRLCMLAGFSIVVLSVKGAEERPVLRVATSIFEPFVIRENNAFGGFSIELWESIARAVGLEFEYVETRTVTGLLDSVRNGKSDLAFSGISMTPERESELDFSYPYFDAGLQILIRKKSESPLQSVFKTAFSVIFSRELFMAVGILCLVLLLSAHLIWWFERKRNPGQFPPGYFRGLWEGFWWAAVTLTTVGYGDKSPRGVPGRLVALVWMFSGAFVFAYFTAGVTAAITLKEFRGGIRSPADLPGKIVATVSGTTADQYLTRLEMKVARFETFEEAVRFLERGRADALVYDSPALRYYASREGRGKVHVVGGVFRREKYAIVFPPGSPYRESVNHALLEMETNGFIRELRDRWFGYSDS